MLFTQKGPRVTQNYGMTQQELRNVQSTREPNGTGGKSVLFF